MKPPPPPLPLPLPLPYPPPHPSPSLSPSPSTSPCCPTSIRRVTHPLENHHQESVLPLHSHDDDDDDDDGRSRCRLPSNCFPSIPCAKDKEHLDDPHPTEALPDEGLCFNDCGQADLREEESVEDTRKEGLAEQKTSFWASLLTSTFAALETKADYLGRSLVGNRKGKSGRKWNVAVRRAVGSGPMRRLQERLLGSRLTASAASGSLIWLLGVCYRIREENSTDNMTGSQNYSEFLEDFCSRIWFSYRKGFEAVGSAKLTSDVGWGCTLRSGQMLLAQALICHRLGRTWRRQLWKSNCLEYLETLQCFGDSSSKDCPFSIHNILDVGSPYGLIAGSWLGPYALCRTLEALACADKDRSVSAKQKPALPMAVYVVSGDADGERGGAPCICIDDVNRLCTNWESVPGGWAPLLLLVPLVLGLDKINLRYVPSLWATFSFPQSLGIAGGKPGASTFLVGVQDDQALYLDPHEVQQALAISPSDLEVDTSSYHCSVVRQMPLNSIDPSLALGFYCRNREEFNDLCNRAVELERNSSGAPMFTVVQTSNRIDQREYTPDVHGKQKEAQESIALNRGTVENQMSSEEDWQIL